MLITSSLLTYVLEHNRRNIKPQCIFTFFPSYYQWEQFHVSITSITLYQYLNRSTWPSFKLRPTFQASKNPSTSVTYVGNHFPLSKIHDFLTEDSVYSLDFVLNISVTTSLFSRLISPFFSSFILTEEQCFKNYLSFSVSCFVAVSIIFSYVLPLPLWQCLSCFTVFTKQRNEVLPKMSIWKLT